MAPLSAAIEGYWTTLGQQHLAAVHGDDLYSLAFFAYEGSHLVRYDGLEQRPLEPPPHPYLESLLAETGPEAFVVELTALPLSTTALATSPLCFSNNLRGFAAIPADQWSGLGFVRRATATTPLSE